MLCIARGPCLRGSGVKYFKTWLSLSKGNLVSSRVLSTGVHLYSPPNLDSKEKEVSGNQMMGILAGHVWPKDNLEVKTRVVGALGLLVGAKVLCVVCCSVLCSSVQFHVLHAPGYQHMRPLHI